MHTEKVNFQKGHNKVIEWFKVCFCSYCQHMIHHLEQTNTMLLRTIILDLNC